MNNTTIKQIGCSNDSVNVRMFIDAPVLLYHLVKNALCFYIRDQHQSIYRRLRLLAEHFLDRLENLGVCRLGGSNDTLVRS